MAAALICIFFLLCTAGITASAANAGEDAQATLEESIGQLYEAIDRETEKALESIGITDGSFTELSDLSPRLVITALLDLLTGAAVQPLKSAGLICLFLVLGSVTDIFTEKQGSAGAIFSLFGLLWVLLSVLPPLTDAFSAALSAIRLGADFLLAYIPVFAGVVAMSGQPLLSAAYSSVMVGLSNVIAAVNGKVLLPLIQGSLLLHVVSVLQEKHSLADLAAFLKKTAQTALTFGAALFTGLLTLKGTLAASGDSLAVRGVKMAVGAAVPVIGGTLSEAYTSVLGSFSLIRNTVGVFGIVVLLLMHLPSILALLLWYFALSFAAALGGALGQETAKKLLEGIAGAVALLNVFLLFHAFLLVISTGVILQFKG